MSVQELLHAFGSGFGRVNPIAVVFSGVMVIGVMAWLVIFEILRRNSQRREEVKIGWRYFEDYAAQMELTPAENETLRAMVRSGEVMSAEMVFDSPYIFEDAMEAYLADEKNRLARDDSLYGVLRGIRFKLGYSHLPTEIPLTSSRQLEEGMPAHGKINGHAFQGVLQHVSERNWQVKTLQKNPGGIDLKQNVEIEILRIGDAEYTLQAPLISVQPESQILVFAHTRKLERKQLRNWVRVEVNLPCRITVVSGPENPGKDDRSLPAGLLVEGRLADLSGGGACARLPTSLPKGHKLSLNFDLPGGHSFRGVHAEVMRMAAAHKSGRDDFEHHLKFVDLETSIQESIVRYVFEKQRLDTQGRNAPPPA